MAHDYDRPDDSNANRHAKDSVAEETSATGQRVKGKIKDYLSELDPIDPKQRVNDRIEKFNSMGVWVD